MHKSTTYCALLLVLSAPLLAANVRKDIAAPLRKGKKGILKEEVVAASKNARTKLTKNAVAEDVPTSRLKQKLATLHPKTKVKMEAALADMQKAGLCPMMTSAYRSTAEQREMYHCSKRHRCKVQRGIFSARKPGTSLHEAGLAVDFADVAAGKKRHRRLTRDGKKIVKIMQRNGFKWRYGLSDPAHFELEPRAAGYRNEQQAIAAAQKREAQEKLLAAREKHARLLAERAAQKQLKQGQAKRAPEKLVSANRRR